MKEYVRGNKKLRVQRVENKIRMDFWIRNIHTYYYKPFEEYESFLNYMLDVWFNVKRGNV